MTTASAFARRPRTLFIAAAATSVALMLGGCSSSGGEEAAAEGKTVVTEFGDVVIPETIESVVVLEGRRDLDIALSLGLPVTGLPYVGEESGLDLEAPLDDAIAEAKANGAEELFLEDEINLEAIAEAAPSLIISRNSDIEPIFDELNAIAPVLSVHSHGDMVTWQEDLMYVAEAIGEEEKAEELIAEYDARVEQISTDYAEQIAATPVVAMTYGSDGTGVQATRLINAALTAVGGLPTTTALASGDLVDEGIESSPEQTLEAHKDALGIIASVETPAEWEELQADALFAQIPAAQNGNVVRTDKQTNEGAYITAMRTLDLVEQLYQGL